MRIACSRLAAAHCLRLFRPVAQAVIGAVNLSKRGEYALRVLLDLTMARAAGRPLVPLAVLAQAQRIPNTFLEQILAALRQAGHLTATRGKYGGYSLAPSAAGMAMGRFIRFLDGPLAPISCASATAYKACTCPDETRCGLRLLMLEARNALSAIFDGMTLQQLAERTLARYREDGQRPLILELLEEPAGRGVGKRESGEPEYLI